ncbi:hypothetical protein D3C87_760170 [compost metagenome]
MKKFRIRYRLTGLISVMILLINSCSKENANINTTKTSTIRLNIGQVFSLGTDNIKASSTRGRTAYRTQTREITYNNQYTLVATLREAGSKASRPKATSNNVKASGASEQKALKEGTLYYIAIFDTSGECKETKSFKQGDGIQDFAIEKGRYTFVIYASGTNAPLPYIEAGAKLNMVKFERLSAYADLMMDQISFEVKEGQNMLNANLVHLFTQVTLKLDASAVGDISIRGATIAPSHMNQTINVSLADKKISFNGAVEPVHLVFQNKSGKVIYSDSTFIATPTTENGIIELWDLSVNGSTPKNVVQDGWNLRPGVKYELEIKLKLPNYPFITVAGTNWSIGDLIYRDGVYKLTPPSDESIYYSWTLSPTDQTEVFWYVDFDDSVKGMRMLRVNGSYAQNPLAITGPDPCASVQPLNSWRLPTSDEIISLMSSGIKTYHARYDTENNVSLKGGLFFGIDSQPAKSEMDQYLYFRSSNSFISAGFYRFGLTRVTAYLLAGKKYLSFEQPYSDDKRTLVGDYEIKPLTFRPNVSAPSEAVRVRCVKK